MIALKIFLIFLVLAAVCHVLFCIYLSIVEMEFIKKELMKSGYLYLNLFLFICVLVFYICLVLFIINM